jgi:DNA-damage-inducible protein D
MGQRTQHSPEDNGMELGDDQLTVALFQDCPIRRTWHDGRWFYSIIDCMAPLAGTPNTSRYWSDLKRAMLQQERVDVYVLGVVKLSLPGHDGRKQKTDCADKEILFRIIQSVKSPNAEPFKRWLARIAVEVLDAPEIEESPDDLEIRAEVRMRLEMMDRRLHQLVSFRGIVTAEQHQEFTDSNYAGLYNVATESALCDMRGYWPGTDARDFMGFEETALNLYQRAMTGSLIQQRNLQGPEKINQAAEDVGVELRMMRERMGLPMPEDLPRHRRLTPGQYLPELRRNKGEGQLTTQTVLPPVWEEDTKKEEG